MTDNRILMTTIKTTSALILSLVLAACSNNPLMRSATATSTDAADAIDRSLEEASQAQPPAPTPSQATATLPDDVSAALLPPLSSEADLDERFDVNARGVPAAASAPLALTGSSWLTTGPARSGSSCALRASLARANRPNAAIP